MNGPFFLFATVVVREGLFGDGFCRRSGFCNCKCLGCICCFNCICSICCRKRLCGFCNCKRLGSLIGFRSSLGLRGGGNGGALSTNFWHVGIESLKVNATVPEKFPSPRKERQ